VSFKHWGGIVSIMHVVIKLCSMHVLSSWCYLCGEGMTIVKITPSFESEKSHPRCVDKIQLEIGPFFADGHLLFVGMKMIYFLYYWFGIDAIINF
jgi:hypothetical protein